MKINLNTASLQELQSLPGIGPVIARRIIAARPFVSIFELQRVNGIGEKRFRALVSDCLVSVDSSEPVVKSTPEMDRKPCNIAAKEEHKTTGKTSPLVEINTASIEELQTLYGVGPVIAQSIVVARTFYHKEQIMAVKGIGPATYEKMKHQIQDIVDPSRRHSGGVSVKDTEHRAAKPSRHAVATPFGHFTCGESLNRIRASLFRDLPMALPSRLLIASWNIRNLSRRRDVMPLEQIASILDEFDLVALQEVRDTMVLRRIKNLMSGWDFVVSPPVGPEGSASRAERFAFFYRRSAFAVVGEASLSTLSSASVRAPFVAHFETRGRTKPIHLTLVNVHVVCGERAARQEEVEELRDLAAHIRMEQEPAYRRNLVLLGDFNLAPHDIGQLGRGGCVFEPVIRAPLATTIGGRLYDNIWMDTSGDWPGDLEVESGVYRIDWAMYPDTRLVPRTADNAAVRELAQRARTQCSNELSDHFPVWLALGGSGDR